jgi:hypothetical protein
MTDLAHRIRDGDLGFLDEETLAGFVLAQRWFGSKSREVAHMRVAEAPLLREEPPLLVEAILEVRSR